MNRYFFTIIVASLLLASCQRNNTVLISEADFLAIEKLNAEEIFFKENRYDEFYIIDSIMLAFNANSESSIIDAYRLPSLDYLGIVARKGRGPGEFLFAEYDNDNYYYENGELKILVFDQLRNIACIVNLSQTIKQQQTILEKEIKFTKDIFLPYLTNKDILLFREGNSQRTSSFYLYDIVKEEYKDVGAILGTIDWRQPYKYNYVLTLFPEDRTKAVLHHSVMNSLSVQDISVNGSILLEGTYSIFSQSLHPRQIVSEEAAEIIYREIDIMGNDVYCLYRNQTLDEMFDTPQPVEIHLFDENLNPKTRYLIDENIYSFAIDGINKTVYGVTVEDEYYKYILP